MIESYIVLAGRIRKELDDLERLVVRHEHRALKPTGRRPLYRRSLLESARCIFSI